MAIQGRFIWAATFWASLYAVAIPIARFTHLFGESLIFGATLSAAAILVLLFFGLLLDARCRHAITQANKEIQGDRPFSWRVITPLDRKWGLLGSRTGSDYLKIVRLVLLVDFVAVLVPIGPVVSSLLTFLAAAAFVIAVLLSLIQLKQQYPLE